MSNLQEIIINNKLRIHSGVYYATIRKEQPDDELISSYGAIREPIPVPFITVLHHSHAAGIRSISNGLFQYYLMHCYTDISMSTVTSTALPTDTFINVGSVTKIYTSKDREVTALRDINLTVRKGEFVAITGESGSGKSTLIQLIGGLDIPTSGTIQVDGAELSSLSESALARYRLTNVGVVFQFFYLQPYLTLRQNVEIPGIFQNISTADSRNRSLQLARLVGLSDRLNHMPNELSGGEIQRTAIARALFNQPSIILADEPTGNLDPKNGQIVIDLLQQVRREFNVTVVVATHDSNVSSQADRSIVLQRGEIAV